MPPLLPIAILSLFLTMIGGLAGGTAWVLTGSTALSLLLGTGAVAAEVVCYVPFELPYQ